MMDTGFILPFLLVFIDGQAPLAVTTENPEQIKYGSVFLGVINAFTAMMTVLLPREEVDLCYQAGMDDFNATPFDAAELLPKLNQLIKE